MKIHCIIGFVALFSAIHNPIPEITEAIRTIKNGLDCQPKFWPKEGTQSNRLKKINIKGVYNIKIWDATEEKLQTKKGAKELIMWAIIKKEDDEWKIIY